MANNSTTSTASVDKYGARGYMQVSHHPPAAHHLLRAEVIVYNYLYILLDAIYTLKYDWSSTNDMNTLHTSRSL